MKKKLAALLALCMLSVTMTAFGGSNAPTETTTAAQTTEIKSDVKDKTGITDIGVSVSLAQNGRLNIQRNTAASVPMGENGTWTIFVYLCGTDLESDGGFATHDLQEMLDASTSSNVRFVIQTGGTALWQNEVVGSDGICRYEISDGEMYILDEQPSASMGSADTLSDFLKWGVNNCPAAKMGLIFWNHGGGSISGVCFDELSQDDSLSLIEIDSALSSVSAKMTDKFEFIGFDACLMGTVETANIIATYSRYMYGSEEIEPGYGWDYTAIGDFLSNDPTADGAELGKVVCDSFYEGCAEIDSEYGATLSVIDLSKIDDVIISFNDYAQNLYEASDDNSVLSAVVRSIKKADNYGGNNKSEGYTNMVDLAGIVQAGAEYAEGADKVLSAIDKAVIYKRNGSDHSDACGLAAYYPLELQGSAELKIFGDVAVSPYYLSFVDRTVYGSTNSGNTENYDNSSVLDLWLSTDETDDYSDYWDNYGECEATGDSPFIVFYDKPQLLDDGTYGFSLTDESLEYTASVQACVYIHDSFCEPLVLILRPELHFLRFLAPDVPHLGCRIAFQPIVPYCMVQDRHQLVMNTLEIGRRVGLLLFIPVGQQLILPGNDVPGFDFAEHLLAKGGEDLRPDHVFLTQPGVFLQTGPNVMLIQLQKGFKGHVRISIGLQLEVALPLLRFPLSGKAPFAFLPLHTLPVVVPDHHIPGTVFLILVC